MEKLNFKKWYSEECSEVRSITFRRDIDRKLEISFQGNLDLYFSFTFNSLNDKNFNFLIGKDNYQVWEIFDKLYKSLISANLYSFTEEDRDRIISFAELSEEDYHEELRYEEERIKNLNQHLKEREEYKRLVKDGIITWKSDEYSEDIAPFFKIEKVGESYLISFDIPEIKIDLDFEEEFMIKVFQLKKTISVRLRNSGSRYDPFNIAFMDAFNSLMDLENTNQIHIEEFLIDKELENGTSLERILRK